MLRRASLTVLFVVLLPATVHAFDHHHHSEHSSGDDGCSSHSSSSSSSSGASVAAPGPSVPTLGGQKLVFVTSTTYSGAIGSLHAADAQCQTSASARGLSGTFQAWLSDATTNAYDRTADVGPWYTSAGKQAFASKSDLRGAPQAQLLDEHGQPPTSLAGAWSGSDANGVATGEDCDGWTNAGGDVSASTGSTFANDTAWGGGNAPLPCNDKAPLVCLQQ